jgi:hypothetical protein
MNFPVTRYIVCLLLLFQVLSLFGQTISGVVTDKETFLPIPYASIGVKGKNMGAIADRTGHLV